MNHSRSSGLVSVTLFALALTIGAACTAAGGCAASGGTGGGPGLSGGEVRMTLVYLVTGPRSAENTPEPKK
ncbi:MAG: hypothetical protein KIT68_11715, partial [Phycisphaeraceae bacterium]|nr:hypothetical protein [Phycisphaeraceae bacterium]